MLAVREHCQHTTKILELSGSFDANSLLGLEAAILGAKEMGCDHIILNFSEITWIDSAGLGKLFLWYHNMKPNHVKLSIVSPQTLVKNLLECAHIPDIVPIFQSEEEAVRVNVPLIVHLSLTFFRGGPLIGFTLVNRPFHSP